MASLGELLEKQEHGPEEQEREALAESLASSSNPIQQQMGHVLQNNKHAKLNTFHSNSDDDNQNTEVSQGMHHAVDINHEMQKVRGNLKTHNVGALIH